MIDPVWHGVRRVLAVRLDGAAGVLATGPALRAMRRALPHAEIVLLTSPAGARAAACLTGIDDVVVYEAPWSDGNWHLSHDSDREQVVIRFLKTARFDAAIVFSSPGENTLLPAYICYLADIPIRVGSCGDGGGSLLTTCYTYDPEPRHEVERALELAAFAGFRTWDTDLALDIPIEESARASVTIADARAALPGLLGPVIAVHPGTDAHPRLQSPELYASLCDLLVERLSAVVLLTGGDSEKDFLQHVRERMHAPAVLLTADISFPALCSVLRSADVTVTGSPAVAAVTSGHAPLLWLSASPVETEAWGPRHTPHRVVEAGNPALGSGDDLAVPRTVVDGVEDLLTPILEPGLWSGEAGWMR